MSGGKRNRNHRCKDGRNLANATLCCMVSTLLWVAVAGLLASTAFAQTESMTIIAGSTAMPPMPLPCAPSTLPVPLCNAGYSNGSSAIQGELDFPYAVAVTTPATYTSRMVLTATFARSRPAESCQFTW